LQLVSRQEASEPPPTELIVTGAPASSVLLVDGVQKEQVAETGHRPYVLSVAPGPHTLEVKRNDQLVYRENSTWPGRETHRQPSVGHRRKLADRRAAPQRAQPPPYLYLATPGRTGAYYVALSSDGVSR